VLSRLWRDLNIAELRLLLLALAVAVMWNRPCGRAWA